MTAAVTDPYVYLCPRCRISFSGQVWEDVLREGRAHDALHAHYDPRYRGLPDDPATLAELPPTAVQDGAA